MDQQTVVTFGIVAGLLGYAVYSVNSPKQSSNSTKQSSNSTKLNPTVTVEPAVVEKPNNVPLVVEKPKNVTAEPAAAEKPNNATAEPAVVEKPKKKKKKQEKKTAKQVAQELLSQVNDQGTVLEENDDDLILLHSLRNTGGKSSAVKNSNRKINNVVASNSSLQTSSTEESTPVTKPQEQENINATKHAEPIVQSVDQSKALNFESKMEKPIEPKKVQEDKEDEPSEEQVQVEKKIEKEHKTSDKQIEAVDNKKEIEKDHANDKTVENVHLKELNESKKLIKNLEVALGKLRQENSVLKDTTKVMQKSFVEYQISSREQITKLNNDIQQKENRWNQFIIQFDSINSTNSLLENECMKLKEVVRCKDLELSEERNLAMKNLNDAKHNISALDAQYQERLSAITMANESLRVSNQQAESANKSLRSQLSEMENSIKELKEKRVLEKKETKSEIENLKSEIDKLSKSAAFLSDIERKYLEIKEGRQTSLKEFEKERKIHADKLVEFKKLQLELADALKEAKLLRESEAKNKQTLKSHVDSIAALEKEKSSLQSQMEALQTKFTAKQESQSKALESEYKTLLKTHQSLHIGLEGQAVLLASLCNSIEGPAEKSRNEFYEQKIAEQNEAYKQLLVKYEKAQIGLQGQADLFASISSSSAPEIMEYVVLDINQSDSLSSLPQKDSSLIIEKLNQEKNALSSKVSSLEKQLFIAKNALEIRKKQYN